MAEELRPELAPGAVALLHGRFNMKDRRKKEIDLATKSLPSVLVATQVVEVSLDISFDVGYFEAAPIDALAQRMGRVNRVGETPVPIVLAAHPLSAHRLYDTERTQSTLNLLRQLSGPISEQDIIGICDEAYKDGYQGKDLADFRERLEHKYFTEFDATLVAGDYQKWTEQVIETANRADVLPATLLPEFNKLQNERRWLEADALTVSIPINERLVKTFVDKDRDPWVIHLPYTADGLEL